MKKTQIQKSSNKKTNGIDKRGYSFASYAFNLVAVIFVFGAAAISHAFNIDDPNSALYDLFSASLIAIFAIAAFIFAASSERLIPLFISLISCMTFILWMFTEFGFVGFRGLTWLDIVLLSVYGLILVVIVFFEQSNARKGATT